MKKYYQPEIETAPREKILEIQNEKLVKQVKHVWDNVPYYRHLMEKKGVTPDDIKSVDDIKKLPFLSKADLRDAYPYGLLGTDLKDCVRIHSTSGTTGKRVVAFYTQHDIDLWEDCVARAIVAAGGSYNSSKSASDNFGEAIQTLSATSNGKGVVILIDEYDDPVARLLDKPDDADIVRGMLADFYGQMKDRTEDIRFLMITGVSKFTKMSIFSALSNLTNLSMNDQYATMLGYTESELDQYFGEHMRLHAERIGLSYDEYRAELKRWFNGYRFGQTSPTTVYNPVSIGINLSERNPFFKASWAETGKASMLMNSIKRDDFLSIDMDAVQDVDEMDFDVSDMRHLRAVPMLYQTGYLTIANYDIATRTYDLCVPDEEVRQDLATLTLSVATDLGSSSVTTLGKKLLRAKWDEFFTGLKALYAALPYGPKEKNIQEFSFERSLYILLKSQAVRCTTEDRQANGQADIVADSPAGVFIFELKVDESADEALKQVKDKHYDAPYRGRNLPIWFIGLNFDRKTRHLLDAKAERLQL